MMQQRAEAFIEEVFFDAKNHDENHCLYGSIHCPDRAPVLCILDPDHVRPYHVRVPAGGPVRRDVRALEGRHRCCSGRYHRDGSDGHEHLFPRLYPVCIPDGLDLWALLLSAGNLMEDGLAPLPAGHGPDPSGTQYPMADAVLSEGRRGDIHEPAAQERPLLSAGDQPVPDGLPLNGYTDSPPEQILKEKPAHQSAGPGRSMSGLFMWYGFQVWNRSNRCWAAAVSGFFLSWIIAPVVVMAVGFVE